MDLSSVMRKNDGFTVRSMGDELLILDPDGSAIHVADEVGAFIYHQIDGERSLADILAALLAEYETDSATAEADLVRFVGEMREQKILSVAP